MVLMDETVLELSFLNGWFSSYYHVNTLVWPLYCRDLKLKGSCDGSENTSHARNNFMLE